MTEMLRCSVTGAVCCKREQDGVWLDGWVSMCLSLYACLHKCKSRNLEQYTVNFRLAARKRENGHPN